MTIQARADLNNEPFVLDGTAEFIGGISLTASQGDLVRGAVLGEVTITPGVYTLCAAASTDGSQFPKVILEDLEVDDSGSVTTDLNGYTKGLFDENQLTFGATTDLDSRIVTSTDDALDITMRDALRQMGIRLAPGISTSGYENPVL